MTDMRKLFERHTAWQKGRTALTWPEKVRMAEAIRDWVSRLSCARPAATNSRPTPPERSEVVRSQPQHKGTKNRQIHKA